MGFWNAMTFGLLGNDGSSATNNGTFDNHDGYKVGDIAYEGLDKKQDSITQFFRSFENAQAKSGQEKDKLGQEGYNTGIGYLDQSHRDIQPAIEYFTKLLGGDRNEVESAAGPQIDQIGEQFDQVRRMTSETAARGGGKASSQVNMGQEQIKQITNLINQLRANAAGGLNATVGTDARIGNSRGQLGLAEQSLGFQDLQSAIQSVESRKGFNVQESGANKQMASSMFNSLV